MIIFSCTKYRIIVVVVVLIAVLVAHKKFNKLFNLFLFFIHKNMAARRPFSETILDWLRCVFLWCVVFACVISEKCVSVCVYLVGRCAHYIDLMSGYMWQLYAYIFLQLSVSEKVCADAVIFLTVIVVKY